MSFSAVIRAAGAAGAFCGRIKLARVGVHLLIGAGRLSLNGGRAIDQSCAVDLTRWRELGVDYRDGKIEVSVLLPDGRAVRCRLHQRGLASRQGVPQGLLPGG